MPNAQITAAAASAIALIAAPAAAQDSFTYASRASEHASVAVVELAAAGVLATAGSVALPVSVIGGASMIGGSVSAAAGESALEAGSELSKGAGKLLDDAWDAPLKVGDAVILAPQPVPKLKPAPAHQ